jgi:Na+/H+ antiporter NhaA
MEALDDIYFIIDDFQPAGLSLEHQLHPFQSFFILPLFALFKAGLSFDTESITQLGGSISLSL